MVFFRSISVFSLVFFVLVNQLFAQRFGGNPSSVKWKQIDTDTVRIIFREGLEESGQRVASVVHELQRNHASTIGNKLQKINIVLQDQPTITNGYVGLGPFRSEFYLFAPQNSFDFGAQNWADILAVHEYRHVQQFNNFNVGLARGFGFLFGQEGRALANSIAIPDWFFEGDAVFNETVLTGQGRGRIPEFFNGYRSLFQEGRNYSYMKLRNGSFRNFVPNHYPLGYMLVSYGREKYGADFWKKVTQDAARFKPLLYPFQGAVEKHSGINYKEFVADAIQFYKDKWQSPKESSNAYVTSAEKKNVIAYTYPYAAGDGAIVVLKKSYRQIPAIYKIDKDGVERRIVTRSITNDDYFSYKNSRIVFASFKPDARWSYHEFSDITLVDAETGSSKEITKKQRLFSPDISDDGQKIVAVNMQTNQQSAIIVMDTAGLELFRTAEKPDLIYTHPKFAYDNQHIYSPVRNSAGQMALVKLNLAAGSQKTLIPFRNQIIGFPTVQGDTVFFSSSYKGSDEVWAFVESENNTYRVATNTTGLYQAIFQPDQNRLIASNFTANGYKLAAIPTSALLWLPVNNEEQNLPDLFVPDALRQENRTTLENISNRNFPTNKYRQSANLFNLHSWRPDYSDPEYSFTIYGQNILNTFQTELAYTYNENEGSHKAGANFIYGGWYVQPTFGISETWSRTAVYNRDTSFNYNEFNSRIGLRLPLNLSGGKQYRFLTLNTNFNNQQVNWTGIGKQLLQNRSFNYIDANLSYSQQIQKAFQHIYPRFAQAFNLQYKGSISDLTANQTMINGNFYFPGIHVNHNVVLSAAFQQRDTANQYRFSSSFPFSRGFTALNYPVMFKAGANYHFPLLYPDWGFGNIVYFNRVRLNGFYDNTLAKDLRTGRQFVFASTGGEIFFDTKWWNQQEVSFGIRYSHLLKTHNVNAGRSGQWEIILPVNLIN